MTKTDIKASTLEISKAVKVKHMTPAPSISQIKRKLDIIRGGDDPDEKNRRGQPFKLKSHERDRKVSEVIINDLKSRGTFYRDGELSYYFDRESRHLIDLNELSMHLERILMRYGINPTEKLIKYVVAELFHHANEHGSDSRIHHFCFLDYPDDGQPTLYVVTENNYVHRIRMDNYERVDNGTDGVLFLSSKYSAPDELPAESIGGKGLIRSLITTKVPFDTCELSQAEAEFFLLGELFGILLRDMITDTKPIYIFYGEKGSGKTTAARMIGQTLYGPDWDVTDVADKVRDFDTLISSQHYVCFDNVDENIKWLDNKLAIAATGGKIARSKLYVTHQLMEYPIISMLATTCRTPFFRRDDVADRMVIIKTVRVERSGQGRFDPSALQNVRLKRKELWGEIIFYLKEILMCLGGSDWNKLHVPSARLQAFARLTVLIARAFGNEQIMNVAWQKMLTMQVAYSSDDNVLFELLPVWVALNQGREVTAGELADELQVLAQGQQITWPYTCGRSLGQKLGHCKNRIKGMFNFSSRHDPAKNQTLYKFTFMRAPDTESEKGDSGNDSGACNPH
ncbi:MAG: hypothetical protein NTY09_01935 [bacterium]|nr:hypothetical protein [bacterium]